MRFKNPFKKKEPEIGHQLTEAQRKGMINNPNVTRYINPMWEVEVTHKGKQLIKMPFCFLVHTHLKDYGFDPDKMRDEETPKVILRLAPGKEAALPLFIRNLQ